MPILVKTPTIKPVHTPKAWHRIYKPKPIVEPVKQQKEKVITMMSQLN